MSDLTEQKGILDLSKETISLKLLVEKGDIFCAAEDKTYGGLDSFLATAPNCGQAYNDFLDFCEGRKEDVQLPAHLFINAFLKHKIGLTFEDEHLDQETIFKQIRSMGYIGLKIVETGKTIYFPDSQSKEEKSNDRF